MIDKSSAIETVLRKIKKIHIKHGLDLRTYKRDRSIVVIRTGEDSFSVVVNGFCKENLSTDFKGLRKHLKRLFKQEFPRSNKIRVYNVNKDDSPSTHEL
ncbi:hypothetical protein [Maridesulfovibrio hydrothermalis]|uniref:Uncharacterized protein n=1 Tax=Maridesulfovibrio hydrothermalis AM13 = DSM 14728 TaxID=1121451 RepID=L0RA00_9BACT|nr:hypothetical protein [Maridesulfovibrio hydrothermalis]CCO23579.1 conserved protein of unknown function [Maridesulfovibrio hydrothermalis AM13 = DSM 14728]